MVTLSSQSAQSAHVEQCHEPGLPGEYAADRVVAAAGPAWRRHEQGAPMTALDTATPISQPIFSLAPAMPATYPGDPRSGRR